MRLHESSDVNFYINVRNGWDRYCRYPANKSWALKRPWTEHKKVWNTYSDINGSRKLKITDEDLYFDCREPTRVNPKACLPSLYSVGDRFIKLEQAPPHGYRCSMMPMNLSEARKKKAFLKSIREAKKRKKFMIRMWLRQCERRAERIKRSEHQIAIRERRNEMADDAMRTAIYQPRCPNYEIFRIYSHPQPKCVRPAGLYLTY